MKILVTGGAGYIGSLAVKRLLDQGYEVIVIDDLSNSTYESLENLNVNFYLADIRDYDQIDLIFKQHKDIHTIMDFAAKLDVAESNSNPELYYDVNVNGLKVILDVAVKYNIKNFIFSSTAAVYGLLDKKLELIKEEDPTVPSNPYGNTKLIGEMMLQDYARKYNFNYIIFRYFNVVGHVKYGSTLSDITTVLPNIIRAINEKKEMKIFGGDYNTPDGTCIRDFIHVSDLVNAHINVIGNMNESNSGIYNLSIGKGTSILELVKLSEKELEKEIPYQIIDRRVGDPVVSAASNEKYLKAFQWDIEYQNIGNMIKETYYSWLDYLK